MEEGGEDRGRMDGGRKEGGRDWKQRAASKKKSK